MKKNQILAAVLCAVAPLAYAESNAVLDEVVVTATRIPQNLNKSLASTTVITQADIQASQAADVPSILRGVAGVELAQNGGMGKTASLFLRGSNSTQVLVLLDGVRINSATTGTTSIQDLMLDQIERIEIVRGNVSSLYGSEAIGGVVQIFTKRGHGAPHLGLSGGVGSLGTQRASAGFGGSVSDTDFNLQVSTYKTNGVSAMNPKFMPKANPDADGYRNTTLSANVRHAFNPGHSVSASAFSSQGDNQFDSAFGKPTDVNTNKDAVTKLSLTSDNQFTDAWNSHLQIAEGTDDNQNWTNGVASLFGSRFKTANQQVAWQNTLQLDGDNRLLLGVERLNQRVSSDVMGGYAKSSRSTDSMFAGYTGAVGLHQFQVNARQDRNSQYGSANTGLLGYGFAFNEAWRATASYSTAFRAPTFNELYYPGFGDATLRPEHSRNGEVGLHYAFSNQHLDVVYFDNRTRDLIVYKTLPVPKFFGPVNVNQARTDGVELSYTGKFDGTDVRAAITSQNPRDETSGTLLDRRARVHGSLSVSQSFGDWQIGGEWLGSGSRQDGGKTLGRYDVLNLKAAYHFSKELVLSLRADNLTNQNDATVYGYNPLGRTVFVGLTYQ